MVKNSDDHESVEYRAASGIYFNVEGKFYQAPTSSQSKKKKKKIRGLSSLSSNAGRGHIMISYQWDVQATMIKVSNYIMDRTYTAAR